MFLREESFGSTVPTFLGRYITKQKINVYWNCSPSRFPLRAQSNQIIRTFASTKGESGSQISRNSEKPSVERRRRKKSQRDKKNNETQRSRGGLGMRKGPPWTSRHTHKRTRITRASSHPHHDLEFLTISTPSSSSSSIPSWKRDQTHARTAFSLLSLFFLLFSLSRALWRLSSRNNRTRSS